MTKRKKADQGIKLQIELTLTEPLLGTCPGDPEIAATYIQNKHPDGPASEGAAAEAEAAPVEEQIELASTYFARNEKGEPCLWDYQIKGFFKDAQSAMNRLPGKKMPAHKKIIDGLIFVYPRMIPIQLSGDLDFCQRPLRTSGPSGDRVALARSEQAPIGSKLTIEVMLLDPKHANFVYEWLDYGILKGLGQWRNSGKGRFIWRETDADDAEAV